MTYIRLDYAVSFFITFLILDMVRELYKDYKFKMKPSDFDSGYRQAFEDVADKWNEFGKNETALNLLKKMHKYIQDKLNGGG